MKGSNCFQVTLFPEQSSIYLKEYKNTSAPNKVKFKNCQAYKEGSYNRVMKGWDQQQKQTKNNTDDRMVKNIKTPIINILQMYKN